MSWLQENAGTIGVALVLVAIVYYVIRGLFMEKKKAAANGSNYCAIGCPGCQGDCYIFSDEERKDMDIEAMRKAIQEKLDAKRAEESEDAAKAS